MLATQGYGTGGQFATYGYCSQVGKARGGAAAEYMTLPTEWKEKDLQNLKRELEYAQAWFYQARITLLDLRFGEVKIEDLTEEEKKEVLILILATLLILLLIYEIISHIQILSRILEIQKELKRRRKLLR